MASLIVAAEATLENVLPIQADMSQRGFDLQQMKPFFTEASLPHTYLSQVQFSMTVNMIIYSCLRYVLWGHGITITSFLPATDTYPDALHTKSSRALLPSAY